MAKAAEQGTFSISLLSVPFKINRSGWDGFNVKLILNETLIAHKRCFFCLGLM